MKKIISILGCAIFLTIGFCLSAIRFNNILDPPGYKAVNAAEYTIPFVTPANTLSNSLMSKIDNITKDSVVIHDTVTVTKFKEKPLIIVCKDSIKKDSLIESPPIFIPNDTALKESIENNNKLLLNNIKISLFINDSIIFKDTINTSKFYIDSDIGLVE